jgi:hypothetical protein
MDWVDRDKAKKHAQQNAEQMYDSHYVQDQGAAQYDPNQYGPHEHVRRRRERREERRDDYDDRY